MGLDFVCFDLDGTLLRGVHSVMYLSILNGRLDELLEIERAEARGDLDWIAADYRKARLARGLPEQEVEARFPGALSPIGGIGETVAALHRAGARCLILTAGPVQVARCACRLWGMDGALGSVYPVENGCFTGEIAEHLGRRGKGAVLAEYCSGAGLDPARCAAVGDGAADVPMFRLCGRSVALNAAAEVAAQATFSLHTSSLVDLLPLLLR